LIFACLQKNVPAALLVLSIAGGAADAGMTQAALDGLAVEPPPNAALPLDLQFLDEDAQPRTFGEMLAEKPAVIVFADYTCRTLCGPILSFVTAGLEQSGLVAGTDYRLIVVGLDPRDDLQSARAAKAARSSSSAPLAAATIMLKGETATIAAVAEALGYRYSYDAEHDQFAHPAAAFVVTPAGRVNRVLSALGLDGTDLRLALVEAGEGRVGSFGDHLRLLCYGFDAVRGAYTETVTLWLEVAAVATMFTMVVAVVAMNAKTRQVASPGPLMGSAEHARDARGSRPS
jgi:protein SCO1